MRRSSPLALLLVCAAACNFPRPMDVPGDAAPGDDASTGDDGPAPDAPSGIAIRVAGTGDDDNDGITAPVKTLKRAIGLAAANNQVTRILLAAGRYAGAGGETFPYTVPTNVAILGPAGGGAILSGTNTEPGMIVGTGTLQDLELEGFSVAITVTGTARLANLRLRTETLAVRAEASAQLTIANLDITGAVASCAQGLSLRGDAEVVADGLSTRHLGTALESLEQSAVDLTNGNLAGDPSCVAAVMIVSTSRTFAVKHSVIDGGTTGARLLRSRLSTPAPTVTFSNTTLRNMKTTGVLGGDSVTFSMTEGALSNNGTGLEAGGGLYTLTSVAIQDSVGSGVYFSGSSAAPEMQGLKLRNCVINVTSIGVYLDNAAVADLGTAASPGGNTFLSVQSVGLYIGGATAPRIDAIGNTWRPSVQAADANGKYPPATPPITTITPAAARANYAMDRSGISLYL